MFGNIKKNWCVISMVQDFSNRHLHLGGSDSNTILASSKFKSVQQLMYEKAQILENTFDGNVYTLIGDLLENKVQEVMGFDNVDEIEYEKDYNGVPFKCHIDGLSKNGKTTFYAPIVAKALCLNCHGIEGELLSSENNEKIKLLHRDSQRMAQRYNKILCESRWSSVNLCEIIYSILEESSNQRSSLASSFFMITVSYTHLTLPTNREV